MYLKAKNFAHTTQISSLKYIFFKTNQMLKYTYRLRLGLANTSNTYLRLKFHIERVGFLYQKSLKPALKKQ